MTVPVRFPLARLALRRSAAAVVAAALAITTTQARAQSTISEASALSALPIAVSVAAPVALLSTGAALTVVSVEATSTGAVWVLERAADGSRASVRLGGYGLAGASVAGGTVVVASAIGTGWKLPCVTSSLVAAFATSGRNPAAAPTAAAVSRVRRVIKSLRSPDRGASFRPFAVMESKSRKIVSPRTCRADRR